MFASYSLSLVYLSTHPYSDQAQQIQQYPPSQSNPNIPLTFSVTPNMSLLDLPPELILHVFESCDMFSHTAALSKTSRHLYLIWIYYLTSICDAILPKVIECYDQAHQFDDSEAHQFDDAELESFVRASYSSVQGKAIIAISRAERLFANQRYSYAIMKIFRMQVSFIHRTRQRGLNGCECFNLLTAFEDKPRTRTDFLQGHYRAWSIMYLVEKNRANMYHVLTSMSLLDFFRMLEIAEWMIYSYSREWEIFRDSKEWESTSEGYRFLASLEIDLVKISGVARPMDEFRAQGPSCLLIFDDVSVKDNADKAKQVALANLLPLIPDNTTLEAHNDLVVPHWLQKAIA